MDKPIYTGFAVLESSKPFMYETYYHKLQPYFGQQNLQGHNVDTDSCVLSKKTENIIEDSKNLEFFFDFSNLDENHGIINRKNKSNW